MKRAILSVAALFLASAVLAQPPQQQFDQKALLDPSGKSLFVALAANSVPGSRITSNWKVLALGASGPPQEINVISVVDELGGFSLMFDKAVDVTSTLQVIVRFAGTEILVCQAHLPHSGSQPFDLCSESAAAATAQQGGGSQVYLNGAYSPAIKSPPQYQIAGSLAMLWDSTWLAPFSQVGLLGTVTTDKRKQIDPDSYEFFGVYQDPIVGAWHGPAEGVQLTWLFAGTEFDHGTDDINLISAPYLDVPIRLFPSEIKNLAQPRAILVSTLGLEAGHNFYNAVTPDQGRAIFRGVIGATLNFTFNPKIPGFQGASLSSAYTVRLPAVDEIFTNTKMVNGKPTDFPFLSRKARQSLQTELDLKVTSAFSLAIKHLYGALPPAFRMVHNQLTIGITYSPAQKPTANSGSGGGQDIIPSTLKYKG